LLISYVYFSGKQSLHILVIIYFWWARRTCCEHNYGLI